MSGTAPVRTWEEASAPAAVRLARRFEAAWRDAPGRRPDPDDFLPDEGPDRPGARLALLRADLALRREAGEGVDAAWYRARYPHLDDDTLVALIFEEFCLREDDQEDPDPNEYVARYPDLAERLRRVFDIHRLVGTGQTTVLSAAAAPAVRFPEAGQTIAGFQLIEELGRGAFARVFLAAERQLADRPVALKVARAGSREPQMLARLQHTHIVPVYSTRTDPATGLHLLCMPYFGRVTLAQILADPKVRVARSGAELVAALDRLGPEAEQGPPARRSAGRDALARRPYPRAIAWWGARMAEALEHAHERGVLHRDVKPSNVLVTGDGMPMLLDFNLARESVLDGREGAPATLGGTLDYMAPEHLEALADGLADRVDGRSDIYSLGVLLYEAIMGARPFTPPRAATSATEVLLVSAEVRRAGVPAMSATRPEVPAELEAVILRCLAPDPIARYAAAADLAVDLQAVADDQALRFAREPISNRVARRLRRHRRSLLMAGLMAAPAAAALMVASASFAKVRFERSYIGEEARYLFAGGMAALQNRDEPRAIVQLEAVLRLAENRPPLKDMHEKARDQIAIARLTQVARDKADSLARVVEPLRFLLIDPGADLDTTTSRLGTALKPFYVLANNDGWTRRTELKLLDAGRRDRLIAEVDTLLFLWVTALDREEDAVRLLDAVRLCDRGLARAGANGPWRALRQRLAARMGGPTARPVEADDPSAETSATACFEWGWLHEHEGRRDRAIAWLDRAAWLEPGNDWYAFCLANLEDRAGRLDDALRHYDVAVALRPHSPWARLSRARLLRKRGLAVDADLQRARDDIRHLLEQTRDPALVHLLGRALEQVT